MKIPELGLSSAGFSDQAVFPHVGEYFYKRLIEDKLEA
jgi:hypothetical protein